MEPISNSESGFAAPYVNTRRSPFFQTPMANPSPVFGASSPTVNAWRKSRSIVASRSRAATGTGVGSKVSAGETVGAERAVNTRGQMSPIKLFSRSTVNPSATATADTLATNIVRARTGEGPSTSTSRLSGSG